MNSRVRSTLKALLEEFSRYYGPAFLSTSALWVPHQYRRPEDQEIAGFIAASLAYGNVAQIQRSALSVLDRMGDSPAAFVRRFDPQTDAPRFRGFVHRFNTGKDLAVLLYLLKQVLEKSGSMYAFFLEGYHPGDDDVGPALIRFVEGLRSLDVSPFYRGGRLPSRAGVHFFLPSPASGSACKRLNLYLRWMVRRGDGIDFGLWREVRPAHLIIPLDTHVARLARKFSLTRRRGADWRTAQEVTRALRTLDPDDPIRYDFALCRYGMLEESRIRRRNLPAGGQGLLKGRRRKRAEGATGPSG